jgi:hypothetical protein
MKYLISLILILAICRISDAQIDSTKHYKHPNHHSLSFVPILAARGFDAPNQGYIRTLLEVGADLRYAYDFWNNRMRLGFGGKIFYTTSDTYLPDWYYFAGVYGQYNFLRRKKIRLYIEVGLHQSNVCFCQRGTYRTEPIKIPNLYYAGFGFGWDIYIFPRWDFKAGFNNNYLLNEQINKEDWGGIFLVGLNFYFKKREKTKSKNFSWNQDQQN